MISGHLPRRTLPAVISTAITCASGRRKTAAVSIREDGLFALHYVHMAAELWLDSTAGWLAVVDGSSQYAMVERFHFEPARTYPGKASIIFWTNGPEMKLNADGEPSVSSGGDGSPYYLEAEINSPLCQLRPGETCDLETEWFPTRAGERLSQCNGRRDRAASASRQQKQDKIGLSGSFGVFFPGRLVAHFYTEHGLSLGSTPVATVDPTEAVSLATDVAAPERPRASRFISKMGAGWTVVLFRKFKLMPRRIADVK